MKFDLNRGGNPQFKGWFVWGAGLAAWLAAVEGPAAEFTPTADLPPLLKFADGEPVTDPADWQRRRAELRDLMMTHFVGHYPGEIPAVHGVPVGEPDRRSDGSVRQRVRITMQTADPVAFEIRVWVPAGDGPFPVMLTQPRDYQIPWADMALARGYVVCLYPGVDSHHREPEFPGYDSVWKEVQGRYPEATWTEISTKAWLASRALDYLLDPGNGYPVRRDQVGIIGFSRYGKQSLIAAAFDERITSVVARSPGSPGSCAYRFTDRSTFAETPADFPGEWFLASLKTFNGREHELPMDAHAWMGLIAPRHCLIHTAHNDGSEPTFAVERSYLAAREVYRFLGSGDHLRVLYRTGQHGPITDPQRRQNLDWFDLSFGRGNVPSEMFPEEFIHRFDWEGWKRAQTAADLTPPRVGIGPVSSPETFRDRIRWMLGEPAESSGPLDRRGAPEFLTAEESAMMTHDRWAAKDTKRIPVRFGDGVRGNIYHNATLTAAAPAVIWLHPYSYHSGYNEGYGVEGTTVYHRLAQAGYVVLAYDQCGFGLRLLEGRDFYETHPRWSRLGRMVADVSAAVDFLVEGRGRAASVPPAIDPGRVFVVGYGVGGMVGMYATALDSRIRGLACFSGFTPMRSDRDTALTGGLERLWKWHALIPKLGLFRGRESDLPLEYDDVLRQIAPRPCLVVAPMRDRHAVFADVVQCVESAAPAWGEGPGRLTIQTPDDVNRFQSAQHRALLDWLEAETQRPNR